MENFSILVPIRRKMEQLEIAIYNLREYSYNKNHEILLLGNCETPEMLDWLKRRQNWLKKHRIRCYSCDLDIDKISRFPEGPLTERRMDGSATAMALNIGVDVATYDWIVAISDDDLFYSKDWDKPFFSLIKKMDYMKHVFRPVHVQPKKELFGEELTVEKFWGSAWKHFSAHRKSVTATRKEHNFLPEDEWNRVVEVVKREKVDFEKCGERMEMHWIPFLFHRDLIKQGPFNNLYGNGWSENMGPGFDLNFDDRLGYFGITKVRPGNSLVLHKGLERQFLLTKKGQKFISEE